MTRQHSNDYQDVKRELLTSARQNGLHLNPDHFEINESGRDFVILYALFGHKGLMDLLRRYEKVGSKTWSRMNEHIAEQWAAYPAIVAKFALTTGKEADIEMARGMIANWNVD